jgi:PKD repeat protein
MLVMLSISPKAQAQPICSANFQYVIGTTTPNGTSVSMYDSSYSVGTITNWNWTVSTGQTSTLQNPVFNFNSTGNYQVCLTIVSVYLGQTCTSSYCDTIVIGGTPPSCNANFSFSNNILGTQFNAQASNNVSYTWSFGDGSAGTGANPLHFYSNPGTYTVCLTVVEASGVSCTTCQSVTIPSTSGCQAYFTSAQVPGTTQYNFTNQSQGNATYFYWNFGDGGTSTQQNPSHSYNSPGNYNVCLTIIDSLAGCSDTYCDSLSIGGGVLCDPTFTFQTSPAATVFAANLQNVGATYVWDFGDGNVGTGSFITHVYANPGTYTACLVVTLANGQSCTSCQPVVIPNSSGCSSNFAVYPDSLIQHTYYAYNLASGVGPLSYIWSWGDGTSSNTAYPSHTYAAAGTYTICLTITDATGCSSNTCYQFALLRLSGSSAPVTINVVAGTTGINENTLLNSLIVSPNPASEFVNANFNLTNDTEVSYSLKNLTGQLIYSSPSTKYNSGSHQIQIQVAEYKSGLYFLELTAGGKQSFTKIVVQ